MSDKAYRAVSSLIQSDFYSAVHIAPAMSAADGGMASIHGVDYLRIALWALPSPTLRRENVIMTRISQSGKTSDSLFRHRAVCEIPTSSVEGRGSRRTRSTLDRAATFHASPLHSHFFYNAIGRPLVKLCFLIDNFLLFFFSSPFLRRSLLMTLVIGSSS